MDRFERRTLATSDTGAGRRGGSLPGMADRKGRTVFCPRRDTGAWRLLVSKSSGLAVVINTDVGRESASAFRRRPARTERRRETRCAFPPTPDNAFACQIRFERYGPPTRHCLAEYQRVSPKLFPSLSQRSTVKPNPMLTSGRAGFMTTSHSAGDNFVNSTV